jgi:hypothetical protein
MVQLKGGYALRPQSIASPQMSGRLKSQLKGVCLETRLRELACIRAD